MDGLDGWLDLSPWGQLSLTWPLAASVPWFALLLVVLARSRPRRPGAGPAGSGLPGEESPAVVNLLVHGWRTTPDAAEATLLDLAARGWLQLHPTGPDPRATSVRPVPDRRPAESERLLPYERRVLDHVAGTGERPVAALTFPDHQQASAWHQAFRREVVEDARMQGLSRRRMSWETVAVLHLTSLGPAVVTGAAVASVETRSGSAGAIAFLTVVGGLYALVRSVQGERDTPSGRERARAWLGLHRALETDHALRTCPPAAVAVWGRRLAYAQAMGLAGGCSAAVDLGLADRRRVWSSFGGTWHEVRVRCPRPSGRFGATVPSLVRRTLALLVAGAALLALREPAGALLTQQGGREAGDRAAVALAVVAVLVILRGLYLGYGAVTDLSGARTVTGEVLRLAPAPTRRNGGSRRPPLHHLAVDDGSGSRTTAWALPSEWAPPHRPGHQVRITARPWSRLVLSIHPVGPVPPEPSPEPSPEPELPSTPRRAPIIPSVWPVPAQAPLLAPEEVTGALGEGGGGAGPTEPAVPLPLVGVAQVIPRSGGHAPVTVLHMEGLAGGLMFSVHRLRGVPLPGVGEEAYTGPDWAIGRRGDTVVRLEVPVGGGMSPGLAAELLSLALSRAEA